MPQEKKSCSLCRQATACLEEGFVNDVSGYVEPSADGSTVQVEFDSASERLQLLKPFLPRKAAEYSHMRVLFKAVGKCTTDHISPGGSLAAFSWSPREYLRQYVFGSGQCLP